MILPVVSAIRNGRCLNIFVGVADCDQRVLCDPVTVNHSGLPAALISDSDNTEEGHNYCPFFDLNRAPL